MLQTDSTTLDWEQASSLVLSPTESESYFVNWRNGQFSEPHLIPVSWSMWENVIKIKWEYVYKDLIQDKTKGTQK